MSRGYDISRYLGVRGAWGPCYTPDGQQILFLTDITGTAQVWSIAAGGGWPHQLTYYDEPVGMISHAPHGDRFVFGVDHGGNERQQLFMASTDGAEFVPLHTAPEVIHTFGAWSPDGRWVSWAANLRDQAYFDNYIQQVGPLMPSVRVLEHDGTNYPLAWSPAGTHLIFLRRQASLDEDLYLLEVETGNVQHLTPHSGKARFGAVRWVDDGAGLVFLTDVGREFMALAHLNLASEEICFLDQPDWDVDELALSPDKSRLAYLVNEDGYSRLVVREYTGRGQLGERLPVPELPPGVLADVAWAPDGRNLALSVDGPRHNPDVWVVDLQAQTARQVTHSARGGIPQSVFTAPDLIRYPSFDGLQIPAYYYRPPGPPPADGLPVIVDVHGGPESQRKAAFNPLAQYFLGRGYALLAPNVRGSTGYGRTYTHLDDVEKRMDAVRDLEYAVQWLQTEGGADPRRIAVMGRSYGGFMVLLALTNQPHLWAAGVEMVGIANLETMLENTGAWRRTNRESEYGSLQHHREFLREISPIHKVHRIAAPLMVVHGANDPRVPVGEAEQMVQALQARNHPVTYLRFENEGHHLRKLPTRIAMYPAIADFLDYHLGGPPVFGSVAGTDPGGPEVPARLRDQP